MQPPPPPEPESTPEPPQIRSPVLSPALTPATQNRAPPVEPSYESLRWLPADKAQIGEIIQTMGTCTKFTLLWNATKFRHYEQQMDAIEIGGAPLHPFKFLETIFGNPSLKKHMPYIFNDFFLKKGFMAGVIKGMEREAAKNNLDRYIEPFARKMELVPQSVRTLIQVRNWEGVVRLLLANDGALLAQMCRS
jgi:hypothetical protein